MPRNADQSAEAGRKLRSRVGRQRQATWQTPKSRDPLRILKQNDEGRLRDLLPIRYGRMVHDPFAFYRGAAAIMASDLAPLPVSGILTQLCGDCHLLNFGAFRTAEQRCLFDVNDFDETALGSWEWDAKRLATSVILAGKSLKLPKSKTRHAALASMRSYREHMHAYAKMPVLELWFDRLDEKKVEAILDAASGKPARIARSQKLTAKTWHAYPSFVSNANDTHEIVDQCPLLFHPKDRRAFLAMISETFRRYRATLLPDRKALFDRFTLRDAAYKVVGVGSVGTRCLVALFTSNDGSPLMLQIKEARQSVLETYAGAPHSKSPGARVVDGERILQAASDLFLGFATDTDGHDYYVRHVHDVKTGFDVGRLNAEELHDYARFCGWSLARAHAKAGGNAALIAGYLGRSTAFDEAILEFAEAYAKQNDEDYERLVEAVRKKKIIAAKEPD
ncbi:MAG TPA: DUF2252 domain-containing protein [Candidatus Cybelea sp.]|nr:DUF2252 domain-containing protein [Candidatus Cybelea sp.]